ncbi:MAG: SRPBCC family protein [Deltaproteobacteria bacterium]
MTFDPKLDLKLERVLDVPTSLVWRAWTEPEHVVHWFVPKPWTVPRCEIELRPGGKFFTVMRSPEGQEMPNTGCYLEVVPEKRLVWTSALLPEFRPQPVPDGPGFHFTAALTFEPTETGTKYTAIAMHSDPEGCKKHEEMGFAEGWGTVLTQLVEYIKGGGVG